MASRIIKLTSENVKRLRAVSITPTGNVVVIGGANGQGKSSVLDSIAAALGGGDEAPDMPVRKGEDKAKVILELEDLIITRTFTAAGGSALVVANKEGARYPKPQDMLDKLTGKLTFDPLEFIRLKPAAQMEALKKLVGVDFTALDAQRKKLYDERTLVNRDAQTAQGRADFMAHYPEAPKEEQSAVAIVAERDAAKEHNAQEKFFEEQVALAKTEFERAQTMRSQIVQEIASLEARLVKLREQLKGCDDSIPALETRYNGALAARTAFKPIDLKPINERLAGVASVNEKVRANIAKAIAQAEAASIAKKADALTTQIEQIDTQKAATIAAASFPVPGLGFGETGVLFNGFPFSQASGAEKLRVSLAMASAMNPKLSVMLIRDGSLLDDGSMALLAQFAAEKNLQVWIERVGDEDASAIIIEDGSVAEVRTPTEATA